MRARGQWMAWVWLLPFAIPSPAQGSSPAVAKAPAFDVVSIRPNRTGSGRVSVTQHDATLDALNIPVKQLLELAFDIRQPALADLPPWAQNAHFDIKAKIVEPDIPAMEKLTREQYRQLYVSLLEQRFGLKWHKETRVLPVYDLVVAKDGPKLKDTADAPDAPSGMSGGGTNISVHGQKASILTTLLSNEVERVVIDRTGLTHKYDFTLKWTREDRLAAAASGQAELPPDTPPSIYTALQEQLGLKLEPSKGPVETLVVDHLEMPTEN